MKKFCRGETEPEALQVLLDLSENEKLADLIGNTKDCIPSLVSLAQNSVPAISEKALRVLSRLSSKTHFVIQMARAGHVRPFLTSFQQGEHAALQMKHINWSSSLDGLTDLIRFLCFASQSTRRAERRWPQH